MITITSKDDVYRKIQGPKNKTVDDRSVGRESVSGVLGTLSLNQ